jgi:hypothetical protein
LEFGTPDDGSITDTHGHRRTHTDNDGSNRQALPQLAQGLFPHLATMSLALSTHGHLPLENIVSSPFGVH